MFQNIKPIQREAIPEVSVEDYLAESHSLELMRREVAALELLQTAIEAGADPKAVLTFADAEGTLTTLLGTDPLTMSLEKLKEGLGKITVENKKKLWSKRTASIITGLGTLNAVLGAAQRNIPAVLFGGAVAAFGATRKTIPDVVPYTHLAHLVDIAESIPHAVAAMRAKTLSDPKKATRTRLDSDRELDTELYGKIKDLREAEEGADRVPVKKAGYTAENTKALFAKAASVAKASEALAVEINATAGKFYKYAESFSEDEYDSDDCNAYEAERYASDVLCAQIYYLNRVIPLLKEVEMMVKLIKGADSHE